jgi:hypothetical protein
MEITMKSFCSLFFFLAFISGCDNIKFGPVERTEQVKESVYTVVYSDTLTKVVTEAKTLTKEDREFAFKQFSGMNQYILNSEVPSSDKLDSLIGRVQDDYKWGREKYPNFTTAVSDYLKEKNYQKAVKFDTQSARESTASIFFDLADAVKKAE